jgi:hypothetical protein
MRSEAAIVVGVRTKPLSNEFGAHKSSPGAVAIADPGGSISGSDGFEMQRRVKGVVPPKGVIFSGGGTDLDGQPLI